MKILIPTKFAIVLYALVFLYFGFNHLAHGQEMAPRVPVPGGAFWIYFTGVAMIAAGVAIIFGKPARIAGYLLALLLLTYIISIHLPGLIQGKLEAPGNLLKDFGLMAGAIIIANIAPEKKNRAVN
ncbi:DoxX family membrane protein [Chitinophaga cymbidii]|uniref:DoxX family protein n=1 Tax=Chitinophaga cymbidii TaxID=1096750 RepID=A0A512RGS3_9BACT|nr:DoxX family membrane protein [Chitinophaga cymbidii]GEP94886.1 hypothetical protein CCY01nite_11460 [Chitinophaga cymbidii]